MVYERQMQVDRAHQALLDDGVREEFPYERTQFIGRKEHYEVPTLADLSVLDGWAQGAEVFD